MAKSKIKIGDRFGKLTVIGEHEGLPMKTVKIQNSNRESKLTKAWLCKCDCGNILPVKQSILLKEISVIRSCGCSPNEPNPNFIPKGMTFEEKQDWDELYEYVRTNIMKYDKTQALSSQTVVRLQGLLKGKYMANNKTVNKANYSYKTVLNTFKFCFLDIQNALRNVNFKDEQHKVNYIFKIVENNINNVYIRERQAKKAKEEAEKADIGLDSYEGAVYKPRKNKADKFNDLW